MQLCTFLCIYWPLRYPYLWCTYSRVSSIFLLDCLNFSIWEPPKKHSLFDIGNNKIILNIFKFKYGKCCSLQCTVREILYCLVWPGHNDIPFLNIIKFYHKQDKLFKLIVIQAPSFLNRFLEVLSQWERSSSSNMTGKEGIDLLLMGKLLGRDTVKVWSFDGCCGGSGTHLCRLLPKAELDFLALLRKGKGDYIHSQVIFQCH